MPFGINVSAGRTPSSSMVVTEATLGGSTEIRHEEAPDIHSVPLFCRDICRNEQWAVWKAAHVTYTMKDDEGALYTNTLFSYSDCSLTGPKFLALVEK